MQVERLWNPVVLQTGVPQNATTLTADSKAQYGMPDQAPTLEEQAGIPTAYQLFKQAFPAKLDGSSAVVLVGAMEVIGMMALLLWAAKLASYSVFEWKLALLGKGTRSVFPCLTGLEIYVVFQ